MGYNELTNSRAKSRPITLFLFQGDVSSEYQIENMLKGVTVIPGTTEFGYATTKITKDFGGGQIQPENWLSNKTESDMVVAIEQLLERAPNLEHVSLVVAWHGTDLRIGECEIKPKVERSDKDTTPRVWQVASVTRATAEVVSYVDGHPAAGGAPADWSIYEAVVFLKSKGLRVTLYPFILMDIPPDNTLPNPYSDDAEDEGQPAFPWRGRITVSPAAGFVGTVDKTASAATQVSAFFGTAAVSDFSFNGTTKVVNYTGPDEWSFRRFILHMATIGAAAGADDFLIGSELVGITTIRSDASTYPSVAALKTLAADCRSILGGSARISYAADWTEYHSHRPSDGSNDVFFHLDPLWSDSNIDFIGIDNYFPISDWRDGEQHLDFYEGWRSIYDLGYLESKIESGEYYDWFYESMEDRVAQIRTPITDVLYGEDWIFRQKDIRSWWTHTHHDRIASARQSIVPSATELAGWADVSSCTHVAEPGIFVDRYTGAQRVASGGNVTGRIRSPNFTLSASVSYNVRFWYKRGTSGQVRLMVNHTTGGNLFIFGPVGNPTVRVNTVAGAVDNLTTTHLGDDVYETFFVFTPTITGSYQVLMGPNSAVVGNDVVAIAVEVLNPLASTTTWVPQSKPIVFTELGCPCVDKGPNQPNVFVDPKSSESYTPFFSDGTRDELGQRAFLEAWLKYWAAPGRNPVSGVYGGPMLDMDSLAVWTWDSRPYPAFPQRSDFWSDSFNWQLGHWLNGRLQRIGEPVGRIASYAYTDSVRPFTFQGVTYQPVPINCGTINASGKLDKSTFEVRLPRTAEIADLFRAYPPSQPVSLIVRQGHINDEDGEFLVAWAGRVLSSKRDGNEVVFACEPTSSSLRRPGLRRSYQFGCPHALYGPGCYAVKQPQTGEVTAINGLEVTLASGWNGPFEAAKFAQGLMEWDTPDGTKEIRRVLRIDGNKVTISGVLRGLGVSDSVTMLLGCAQTTSDCLNLHNNIHNFGGCPTIPTQNPLASGVNVFY